MTASFIGFVNGDGPSSLTRQATVTPTATSASGPGAYQIIASGALSPDYSINYVSGILVVTASPATPHPEPGRVAFLTTVYGEVLGRAAEPSGLRYWRRRLAAGATPGEVVREFFGSP